MPLPNLGTEEHSVVFYRLKLLEQNKSLKVNSNIKSNMLLYLRKDKNVMEKEEQKNVRKHIFL